MKVRCIDASNCGETLTVGKVYEAAEFEAHGERRYWVTGDTGELAARYPNRFEPVTDEPDKDLLNLAFPCPKVDHYTRHRLDTDETGLARMTAAISAESGATARLHAGLESEKVRERVKAFPHPARNPR